MSPGRAFCARRAAVGAQRRALTCLPRSVYSLRKKMGDRIVSAGRGRTASPVSAFPEGKNVRKQRCFLFKPLP